MNAFQNPPDAGTPPITPRPTSDTTPPASPPAGSEGSPPPAPSGSTPPAPSGSTPPAPPAGSAPPPANPPEGEEDLVPRRRVDVITKEKWEAKRQAEELRRENERLRRALGMTPPASNPPTGSAPAPTSPSSPQDPGAGTPPAHDPTALPSRPPVADVEAFERLVAARAAEQARVTEFNARCNAVYQKGISDQATAPGFQAAVAAFDTFGGLGQFPEFLDAATSLPDAHKVLHHLGTHLDEAERILSLPPAQQGVELGRLSVRLAQPGAPARVSAAPPPPVPVRGSGGSAIPAPDANGDFKSQEEFRRWREAQRQARHR